VVALHVPDVFAGPAVQSLLAQQLLVAMQVAVPFAVHAFVVAGQP
jgi:hypothetical protein